MANEKKGPVEIENRKARHDFYIDDTYEAGIVLTGTEVKSIRQGKASLVDSFAYFQDGEIFLKNMYIKEFDQGSYNNHDPHRVRKLLLNKVELAKLDRLVDLKGYTLVPLKIYFKKGFTKVLLGVAKGKKLFDKRATIAEKDVKRELSRTLKNSQFST